MPMYHFLYGMHFSFAQYCGDWAGLQLFMSATLRCGCLWLVVFLIILLLWQWRLIERQFEWLDAVG